MSSDSEDEDTRELGLPWTLKSRDLESVAKYIQSDECQNVFVMVGAGMSVAAGIPDFRSPTTGLYSNLGKFNLPYAEAIFELSYFRESPAAFYAFAADFDPSKFRPTLSHSFVRLLDAKGLLRTCFTQNIDGLETRAHIPEEKLVEAHGTITTQRCANCRAPYDGEKMWTAIKQGDVAYCEQPGCGGPIKPDIVFFGEALPERFGKCAPALRQADLLLILGTSLKVYPFAALTGYVMPECPRVLINLERAGDIGVRDDDVLCLGKCDAVVRELSRLLGWEDELENEWETTRMPEGGADTPAKEGRGEVTEEKEGVGEDRTGEAKAQDEVEKLADDIGRALAISDSADTKAAPKNELGVDATGDALGCIKSDETLPKVEVIGK